MLEGSLITSRSTPFPSMAFRVLARRSANSPRENFRFGCIVLGPRLLGLEPVSTLLETGSSFLFERDLWEKPGSTSGSRFGQHQLSKMVPALAARARLRASVAIAVSCTPVPVRSAMVMSLG